MNRTEKLAQLGAVYDKWIAKYENDKTFNPENPTPEQEAEYHTMALEIISKS